MNDDHEIKQSIAASASSEGEYAIAYAILKLADACQSMAIQLKYLGTGDAGGHRSKGTSAAGRYHSKIAPKAVLATLDAFEIRYDLPMVHAESPEAAARLVERWVWRYAGEVVENGNDLLRGSQGTPVSDS
jgi:hypothetical protein